MINQDSVNQYYTYCVMVGIICDIFIYRPPLPHSFYQQMQQPKTAYGYIVIIYFK